MQIHNCLPVQYFGYYLFSGNPLAELMTDAVPEDKPPAPIMGLGAGFGDALTSALDVMAFTNDISLVASSTLFGNIYQIMLNKQFFLCSWS